MNGKILACAMLCLFLTSTFAANIKIGYIDGERIRKEYKAFEVAQKKLSSYTAELEKEVTELGKKKLEIENQLKEKKLLLSDKKKSELEQKLKDTITELKRVQQSYFGQDGKLYQKNKELLTPITAEVKKAIEKVAKTDNYLMVFDSDDGLVYGNPSLDITDKVLKVLNSGK